VNVESSLALQQVMRPELLKDGFAKELSPHLPFPP